MVTKKIILCLLLLLSVGWLQAEHDSHNFEYKNYDWSRERKTLPLAEGEDKTPAIVMKDKRVIEYIYDEKGQLKVYETLHKIIKVNTDDGVQSHNKMYISMNDVLSIVELKARFISQDGHVVELDKNNIKELENPENAGAYKIFAIEGVETGGEIEYLYTLEQYPRFFGREIFQGTIPSKNIDFEIITPRQLVFEAKSYNGFPGLQVQEEHYRDKNALRVTVDKIAALQDERFSLYASNLMRVDFKLVYNQASGAQKVLTWDDAARVIHQTLYQFEALSKKEIGFVRDQLKEMIPVTAATEEEKIRAIEDFVKTNIRQEEGDGAVFDNPIKMLENKYGNKIGMVKLFALLFTYAGIDHQVVLTTDRSQVKFDGSFESWYYLEKYLFYFPQTKAFIAANHPEYRYGLLPYYYTNNDALFVTTWKIGDSGMTSAEIKTIPPASYQRSYDVIELSIRFAPELDELKAHVKRNFTGYNAIPLQYYYQYSSKNEQNILVERILRRSAEDARLSNVKVNQAPRTIANPFEQFSVEADITSSALIENAGDRYLFRIGELIGQQSELYQDTERVTAAENDYKRGYRRIIEFEVPQGYVVRNLEDLNFDVFLMENTTKVANFTATYTLEGNKVKVSIEEYYRKVVFDTLQFEGFRKVINAAADFNKVVLVFEKTR